MRVDMHIHTQASDGSWSPQEVIENILEQDIRLFAVTDHDTVAGLSEFLSMKPVNGLAFLPGVEICSTYGGQSYHILGYGINPASEGLLKILRHNTKLLEDKDDECIQKLIAEGMTLDFNEYCQYEHDRKQGGWKALNFLIDKGMCTGVGDFFARLFTKEKGISFPEFPKPAEVINAILSSGGIPILAHPGSDFHGMVLEETLDFFAHQDIQGIECFHPSHDDVTTKRAIAWCKEKGMLITGGSDCHGSFVPGRALGNPVIMLEHLHLGGIMEKVVPL